MATNLMEHSTCTLDISSDEESAAREMDMRGKENVPPPDDISQTRTMISSSSTALTGGDGRDVSMAELKARMRREDGAIDIDRSPLGDLAVEDFYAEGCDKESVFIVGGSERASEDGGEEENVPVAYDFVADVKGKGKEAGLEVDASTKKDDLTASPKTTLPVEPEAAKTVEGTLEVWSGSTTVDQ